MRNGYVYVLSEAISAAWVLLRVMQVLQAPEFWQTQSTYGLACRSIGDDTFPYFPQNLEFV